jgi:hypothetical protein
MGTRACVVAAACAIAAAPGCGSDDSGDGTSTTPTIDPAKIEPKLRDDLSQYAGVDPSTVGLKCPSGEPAEEGRQFKCTLTAADGSSATVRVTVTRVVVSGDQLNYHVEGVVPRSQFKAR